MSDKMVLPEEVREQFREAGRAGGNKTAAKHGSEFFRDISAKGKVVQKAKREKTNLPDEKDAE